MIRRFTAALLLALGVASTTTPAAAQSNKPLFTAGDAALAAGFAGLTVALFPTDRFFARHLHDPNSKGNRFLNRATTGLELIATPGSFFIGGSLYAVGRLANKPDIANLGWHGTEAILVGSATTGILKGILGRERPYATSDTNPRDFKLMGGFGGRKRQSFPSGHSTTAFAAAASVTSEVNHMWPNATWVVAPVLYGGATMVGLSRMYHDQHWASDVVLGAAIGTFAGLKIVRYTRAHPNNAIDRAILGKQPRWSVPIGWSLPLP